MAKIQTGLRIPEDLHAELSDAATQMGVSLNMLLMVLISTGWKAVNDPAAIARYIAQAHVQ